MISMEYCPTSVFICILSSSWKPAEIFPSSDTSLTWGHKNKPTSDTTVTCILFYLVELSNLSHATSFRTSVIQPVLKVTWDLTKVWRLVSKPLASGVITSTVKWASNSRHIQSIIWKFHQMETNSEMRENQTTLYPELLNQWRNVCLDKEKIKIKSLQHLICPAH